MSDNQTVRRAIRLATMAIMLRDGHRFTSERVVDMFGISRRVARLDLEHVGEIVPTRCSRQGQTDVYIAQEVTR